MPALYFCRAFRSVAAGWAGAALAALACNGSSSPSTPSGAAGRGGAAGAAGGGGCGAATAARPPAEPVDECTVAADCEWGEIDHEISSSCDCICLFGCPSLPLSKSTVERRNTQFHAVCTAGTDGSGRPCPVDDCVAPPPIACVNGRCQAAPVNLPIRDAG